MIQVILPVFINILLAVTPMVEADANIGRLGSSAVVECRDKKINIRFEKIDPTLYRASISRACGHVSLVLNQRFDPQWQAYILPKIDSESCSAPTSDEKSIESKTDRKWPWERWQPGGILLEKSGFENSGIRPLVAPEGDSSAQDAVTNVWRIDVDNLKKVQSANTGNLQYCLLNPDGTIDFDVAVEYFPQRFVYIGYFLSGLSIVISVLLVVFLKK